MISLATEAGVRAEHVLAPLVEGADEVARLSFDNGVGQLGLRADGDLYGLLDARFVAPLPMMWVSSHRVHVEYPLRARARQRLRLNMIRINPRTPWSIDVHGRAYRLTADLTAVDLRSLTFHAAAAQIHVTLGRPAGRCPVRLTSVRGLSIDRPADVPVRLEVAGRLVEQSPDYETADDRYLLTISGSAVGITVTP